MSRAPQITCLMAMLGLLAAARATPPATTTRPAEKSAAAVSLAWSLLSDGEQAMAEQMLLNWPTRNLENVDVLFLMGVIEQGRVGSAATLYFYRASKLAPDSDYGRASSAIAGLGSRHSADDDLATLRELVRKNPADPALIWATASVAARQENFGEAIGYCYALAPYFKVGPARFHELFAEALDATQRFDEALAHRLLVKPPDATAYSDFRLGSTYVALKRYAEAEAALGKATRKDGTAWRFWADYAKNAAALGHYADAESRYDHAIALAGPMTHLQFGRADALERQGRAEAALDAFLTINRPAGVEIPAATRVRIATLLDRLGRHDEAEIMRGDTGAAKSTPQR